MDRDDEDTPLPIHAISDADSGPETARVLADLTAREILQKLPIPREERDRYVGQVGALIRRVQRRTTKSYRAAADREVDELLERVAAAESRLDGLGRMYARCTEEVERLTRELIKARDALR